MCETSQTEYISRSREGDGGEEDGVQVKSSVNKEEGEAKVEEMARLNVKMLFLHNEQVRVAAELLLSFAPFPGAGHIEGGHY